VVCVCGSAPTRGSQAAEAQNADENATKKPRALTKRKEAKRAARRRRNKAAKSEEAMSKGKRTSRDNHRLTSLLEASVTETTVETNTKECAAEAKVETNVAKKVHITRKRAFSFRVFIAAVLLA
jgi:hypothetical protein